MNLVSEHETALELVTARYTEAQALEQQHAAALETIEVKRAQAQALAPEAAEAHERSTERMNAAMEPPVSG